MKERITDFMRRVVDVVKDFPLTIWVGLVAIALFAFEWWIVLRQMFDVSIFAVWTDLEIVADGLVIMLPYWFLRGRWRWSILVPVWACSLFMLANLLYSRQFGSFIPFSSYTFTQNFTPLLIGGAVALFRGADIIFILLPLAFTVWLVVKRKSFVKGAAFSRRFKLLMSVVTVVLFLCGQCFYTYSSMRLWKKLGIERSLPSLLEFRYVTELTPNQNVLYNGFVVNFLKSSITEICTSRSTLDYSDEQVAHIRRYLDESRAAYCVPDSVFSLNADKNLIFIVVESLNGWTLDYKLPDGSALMPVMQSLRSAPGTISCSKVISQACAGGSSDGVLLYNTGLLPMRSKAASMIYSQHDYPSLAKIFSDRPTAELICEESTMWNHANMSKAYGYDRLYEEADLIAAGFNAKAMGHDKAVMGFASWLIPQLERPFFIEITTLSTHMPFNESDFRSSLPASAVASENNATAAYLRSVRYFDDCLGMFIDDLKRMGIYDDTVIVIASDHNCSLDDAGYENGLDAWPGEILFMAVNTGIHSEIDANVGQVDVFPTILDIMGVDSSCPWRGVGKSIIAPGDKGAVDKNGRAWGDMTPASRNRLNDAWEVSDLIIRGNFFGKKL